MPGTRSLSLHATYACRSSGACCTSGWAIPVERHVELRLRQALDAGVLRAPAGALREVEGKGAAVLLGHDAAGRCLFFEGDSGRQCTIHRELGHEALPVACQQFPRVAVLTPLGISVSLSHYCPTATALLFDHRGPLVLVENAPAFPEARSYEGLEARGALPPLLRPDALLSWDDYAHWESHVVRMLEAPALPEQALARLTRQAERARGWEIERGPLSTWLSACLHDDPVVLEVPRLTVADAVALREVITQCVPEPLRPSVPLQVALEHADARHVANQWSAWSPVVARYLAARAFASWCALQGQGLRTAVAYLWTVLGVLRAQVAQTCAEAERALDRSTLESAIRASDLLLLHLADQDAVAACVSRVERKVPPVDRPWAAMLAR